MADEEPVGRLLATGPKVINIGLVGLAEALRAEAVPVVHVQWSPPAGGDAETIALLDRLDT